MTSPLRTGLHSLDTGRGFRSLRVLLIALGLLSGITAADPTVSVVATDATANESGDVGVYTITRAGDTTASLVVQVAFSGTTTFGSDYAVPPATVTIPAGAASTTLTITPLQDSTAEVAETVILSIGEGPGYAVGSPATATITLNDDDAPVLTVVASDATGAETVTGQTANPAKFTITRLGSKASALTVPYTLGGSAIAGTDYVALTGSVTLAANVASVVVTITPIDDQIFEGDETVTLTALAGSGYVVGLPAQAQATLQDDEPQVTIAATDAAAGEGAAVGGDGTFTLTRRGRTDLGLVVRLAVGGSAAADADYPALATSVYMPVGVTTATLTVSPSDDALPEGPETVVATVLSGPNYTVGAGNTATITIADDENIVTIAATDAIAAEPGSDKATLTISRTGSTTAPLTVAYTVAGTATSGSDFTALTGTATILATKSSVAVSIVAKNDTLSESAETVVVTLAPGSGYGIGATSAATAFIRDNDTALPTLTIMALEPVTNEGGAPAVLHISRSGGDLSQPVVVNLKTSGTATNGVDDVAIPGTITIPANDAGVDVLVSPVDDTTAELTETVTVTLQAGATYTLGVATAASATIADNDATTLTIAATDASAREPGTDTGLLTITRKGVIATDVEVRYLVGGMAANGADYAVLPGTLTLPADVATVTLSIVPLDDGTSEPAETVAVTLSAGVGYIVGSAKTGTVTIADDDTAGFAWSTSTPASETGTVGSIRLVRLGPTGADLTTTYTVSGTAGAGVDYVALSGTATIPAASTYVDIPVTPIDDALAEGAETVVLTLPGSVLVDGSTSAEVVINDDEPNVSFTTVASTTPESAGSITVTAALSIALPTSVKVSYTVGGTATNGATGDFALAAGTRTIPAGAISTSFVIPLYHDDLDEGDETIVLTLTKAVGASLGAIRTHTITLTDDDATPVVAFAAESSTVTEADGSATIIVGLSQPSSLPISLLCTCSGGTATPGSDFTLPPTALTISPGATTATITVPILADSVNEGDETVLISLGSPTNAGLGSPAVHTLTILGQNQAPTIAADAFATPNPVTTGATNLSVLGEDDAGEANLTYTWSASGPAPVSITPNGTNASKQAAATFTATGSYVLTVTVADAAGLSVSQPLPVTVSSLGDPAQPPAAPTVTLAITSGLSGVEQAVIDGEHRWFTKHDTITVTASVDITDGATLTEAELFVDGATVTATGPTTWTVSNLPEGRIEMSASATVTLHEQTATGSISAPEILIADRTPPLLSWLEPQGSDPLGVGLDGQGPALVLNGSSSAEAAAMRTATGLRCWPRTGFAVDAVVDDLSGLSDDAVPTALVGGTSLSAAVTVDGSDATRQRIAVSGFDQIPDGAQVTPSLTFATGLGVQALRVTVQDRCGNVLDADQFALWVKTTASPAAVGYVPWDRDAFPTAIGVLPAGGQTQLSAISLVATPADVVAVEQQWQFNSGIITTAPAVRLTGSPQHLSGLPGSAPVLWRLPFQTQAGVSGLTIPPTSSNPDRIAVRVRTLDAAGNRSAFQDLEVVRAWVPVDLPAEGTAQATTTSLDQAGEVQERHTAFTSGFESQLPYSGEYWPQLDPGDAESYVLFPQSSGLVAYGALWFDLQFGPQPAAVRHSYVEPLRLALQEQPLAGTGIGLDVPPANYGGTNQHLSLSSAANPAGTFASITNMAPSIQLSAEDPNLYNDPHGYPYPEYWGMEDIPLNWPKSVVAGTSGRSAWVSLSDTPPTSTTAVHDQRLYTVQPAHPENQDFPLHALYQVQDTDEFTGAPVDGHYRWNELQGPLLVATVPSSWSTGTVNVAYPQVATTGRVEGPFQEGAATTIGAGSGALSLPIDRSTPGGLRRLQWEIPASGQAQRQAQQCGFRSIDLVRIDRDVLVAGGPATLDVDGGFLASMPTGAAMALPAGTQVRICDSATRTAAETALAGLGGADPVGVVEAWLTSQTQAAETQAQAVEEATTPAQAQGPATTGLLRREEVRLLMAAMMPNAPAALSTAAASARATAPDASLLNAALPQTTLDAAVQHANDLIALAATAEAQALADRVATGAWVPASAAAAIRQRCAAERARLEAGRVAVNGWAAYGSAVYQELQPWLDQLADLDQQEQQLTESVFAAQAATQQSAIQEIFYSYYLPASTWSDDSLVVSMYWSPYIYTFPGGAAWNAIVDQRQAIYDTPRYQVLVQAANHVSVNPFASQVVLLQDTLAAAAADRSAVTMPEEARIAVGGMTVSTTGPSAPMAQRLSVDLSMGSNAAGLYDVDVTCGIVTGTMLGAYRMKESLAVVAINYETESDQNPSQIAKTVSAPHITVSPSVSVNGTNATVSLSGTVTDSVANLLQTPAMKSVHVYHHNQWVGDIALTTTSDIATDWKPYSKSFAFSGSVTIPAWEGEHLMNIVTDANETGIQGSAKFSATMDGTYPNPVIRESVAILLSGDLQPTQTDAITLVIPSQYIGQAPATVMLTETALDSNVFQDGAAIYRVTLSEGGLTDTALVDTISAEVERNGAWYCEEVFTETGPATLHFEAPTVHSNEITVPTVMTYTVDLGGAITSAVVDQIALTLPAHIAGPSPTPITLIETGADTKVFTAVLGSTGIRVDLLGATTGTSISASVTLSDSQVVTANFSQIGGTTSTQYQCSTTIASAEPSFSLRSVSSAVSPAQQETVTPYRISIQAPLSLDNVIANREWSQNGIKVDLLKKEDRYYVKDPVTGKPMVFVDPAWSPVNGTTGTEGGEDEEGPVTFSGTDDTIHIAVTIGISRSRLPTPVPDTYTVTVTVSPDAAQHMGASVIGLDERDTWTTQEVRGFAKTAQGNYQVTLVRQGAIQVAGNVAGASLTEADVKIARANPKTFLDDKLMAWYLVQGESDETTGWVWNATDNPILEDDVPLWTLPNLTGAPSGNALSLSSSVIAALTQDVVIPGLDPGVERIVQNAFIAHVGFGGAIRTWDLPEARSVYTWVALHAAYKVGDTDIPFGKKSGDLRYEKEGAFDLVAAVAGYNKANAATYAAAQARREERIKIARELGWELRTDKQSVMNAANQTLSAFNQMSDVTAWAGYISGGKKVVLPEGDATWAAVGIEGGFLLLNFVPFGKIGSVVGKAGKVLFRKVGGEAALPAARKAIKDLIPTETLVRASAKMMCFVAGTKVKTAEGFTSIEQVQVGDMVWSRDERTGKEGLKRVEQTFVTTPTVLIHLRYKRMNQTTDRLPELIGTATHPFWIEQTHTWVPMGELRPGYQLRVAGGDIAVVESILKESASDGQHFTTYNFSVSDWQTYFVAPSNAATDGPAVWVHNIGGFCDKAWEKVLKSLKERGEARFFEYFNDLPKWQVRVLKAQNAGRQLLTSERDAVREAARALWKERTGKVLTEILPGHQVHHRIELQFAHLFPDNPNAIDNVFAVKADIHRQITEAWETWLRAKGGIGAITKAEVEAQATVIDAQFHQFLIPFP